MFNPARRLALTASLLVAGAAVAAATASQPQAPSRDQVLATMKRATAFMREKVAYRGGYVWNYLPDRSRRWGEMEARPSMIWIQPPGTPSMGHLFLDAFHATGDAYYYEAAEEVAGALIAGQHPSGGWNYMVDFAGEPSLREWYDTVGKNGWRLEEFQHYWGNATFDDAGTADASKFLLRLYAEKKDPKYKPALDKAIRFVLDSQHPQGFWPQRFPRAPEQRTHGKPDYTSYPTFNDDVAAENVDVLLLAYQVLGDERLLEPIRRGMDGFLIAQQPAPQAGWGLQYSPDLKPVGARTYEPDALVTHTTAANIASLMRFYRLTGDAKYLARIPEALDWLDSVKSPPGVAPAGRTHPTFVEIGTNKPLYVHRRGSNVVNGRYYVDGDPANTVAHYSSFRAVDVPGLRRQLADLKATPPAQVAERSPLRRGAERPPLPRFFTAAAPPKGPAPSELVASLNGEGYWLAPLGYNSHPYKGDGSKTPAPGDFSRTYVGDGSDTSPYPDPTLEGISIDAYIRNMGVLIRHLDETRQIVWRIDRLDRIGGHAVEVVGAPRVVETGTGAAVEFDGARDGLIVAANPVAGLSAFTIEAILEPALDGQEEQRFLHVQESDTENRALLELRLLPGARWVLDTYLRHGETGLTLIDRDRTHPAGRWHAVALTFDGKTMTHYVNGVKQGSGFVTFRAMSSGRTSIGVRQNLVSHFKGRIRLVRFTATALAPDLLLEAK